MEKLLGRLLLAAGCFAILCVLGWTSTENPSVALHANPLKASHEQDQRISAFNYYVRNGN
ncbi:hypothetical protein SAMN04487970_101439 [Paenibacillus tianmuensis]|uniref:Uncharacterized protein n=1 Tax=Paenibacillus tianmuensis TaxID=624147 RepID=A0A1G4RBV2_9BACL|nr:hypothetical protein [Paenibacillus tianmuensis]SCW54257.1 hypothetical protein SAMN04487970_101439 [Paenibacillus tianmuensis]